MANPAIATPLNETGEQSVAQVRPENTGPLVEWWAEFLLQHDLPLVRQQAIPAGAELKDCAASGAKEPSENNSTRHAATRQRFHLRTVSRPSIPYPVSISHSFDCRAEFDRIARGMTKFSIRKQ